MSETEQHAAFPELPPAARRHFQQQLIERWPQAVAHWSQFLLLADPVEDSSIEGIAMIDLRTRRVSVNGAVVLHHRLSGSIEALLAHEVGHHVSYPGSLRVSARMRTIERRLLPLKSISLMNLFADLMINRALSALCEQHMAIYRAGTFQTAYHAEERWRRCPLYAFYLAIYEELWQQPPGSIMGPAVADFERAYPEFRSEAQLLAQNLFRLGPNHYTQFLYFLSYALHYIHPLLGEEPESHNPYACHCAEPSPDDWADALNPTRRERDAVDQALDEGWFPSDFIKRLRTLKTTEGRLPSSRPGTRGGPVKRIPEVMAAWYRAQAENYLLRPPPRRTLGEGLVPTTLEDWEFGESPRDIDWTATLLERGAALGSIAPLQRILAADYLGQDVTLWQPRTEIYLDVSGSMPDPGRAVNAMTLAAQILALGTIREGGWVRAALYSSKTVKRWDWCRSERELAAFLMHYVGTGTSFPFALLDDSVTECRHDQPIRVLISDQDFDRNVQSQPEHSSILSRAASVSPHFILLQHRPDPARLDAYRKLGVHVVEVHHMNDFPRMATDLTNGLFPEGHQRHAID